MSLLKGMVEIQKQYWDKLEGNFEECFRKMYNQMLNNWHNSKRYKEGIRPSEQNWRFTQEGNVDKNNFSKEKCFEKAIVNLNGLKDWANQVPVASGYISRDSDKKRCIDLVHKISNLQYEMIELKIKSNTPYTASRELLQYAMLYIFALKNLTLEERDRQDILKVITTHWCVLAPRNYYKNKERCLKLASLINEGLYRYLLSINLDRCMTFKYKAFPEGFKVDCRGKELIEALNGAEDLK